MAEDVRTRILEVSTHLFGERGYAATSLQAVAEEVGIRKQSVLHHFSNKEELRLAVLNQLVLRWNETLPQILLAVSDGKDRLDAIISTVVGFFADNPDRARLLQREMLDRPLEMRALVAEHTSMWTKMIVEAINEGTNDGTVWRDVNAEAFIVQIMILIVSGLGQLRALDVMFEQDDNADPREVYTRELQRLAKRALFVPVAVQK